MRWMVRSLLSVSTCSLSLEGAPRTTSGASRRSPLSCCPWHSRMFSWRRLTRPARSESFCCLRCFRLRWHGKSDMRARCAVGCRWWNVCKWIHSLCCGLPCFHVSVGYALAIPAAGWHFSVGHALAIPAAGFRAARDHMIFRHMLPTGERTFAWGSRGRLSLRVCGRGLSHASLAGGEGEIRLRGQERPDRGARARREGGSARHWRGCGRGDR